MPNLSSYIDFAAVLRKEDQVIRLTDPNNYPSGVAETLEGFFTITQPDGITVTGSFSAPEVYWDGGALTQPEIELRLNSALKLQKGGYTMLYTARATGYDVTTLTKTFTMDYTAPVPVLTKNFDVFTPDLSVTDATAYTGVTGNTYQSIVRAWECVIESVEGTNQAISGTGITFDLAYQGAYYDSVYPVTLITNVTYGIDSSNGWASLVDTLEISAEYTAYIPPTIAELLVLIADYKVTYIDAKGCVCGKNCNCGDCTTYKSNYNLAVSIYSMLMERGRLDDTEGLVLYVTQLQKILNNCVNPTYVNTFDEIPPYVWGGGSGATVAWNDITGKPSTEIIEWTVGAPGFPAANDTRFTDARLDNIPDTQLLVFRNVALQFTSSQADADSYITKITANDYLDFSAALEDGEKIVVVILPL